MTREPMTENELLAFVDAEARQSFGWAGGRLSEARKKAMDYYLGNAVGDLAPPEIEGRSTVVSNETLATVEWMLPQLIRIFTAGDSVVEFTPNNPQDEQAAQDATEYVNYVFQRQNPGFMALYSWFKDALLQKNGFLKVYWDTDETQTKERYQDLDDNELALLLTSSRDAELVDAESTVGADGVPRHSITLAFKNTRSQVRIENVPPEEILVSRKARSLAETPFVAHRRPMSVGELKALGYDDDLIDTIGSEDSSIYTQEAITRRSINDEQAWDIGNNVTLDPSTRIVWVIEAYAKVDFDGDGLPEWRMIRKAGNTILDNIEVDGHPFVTLTPIPLPHQMFGLSMADLTQEPQRIKTSVMRSLLDNLYLTVNQRFGVVDGQANLDDLLTSRPGGVVRVKSPGAVFPLAQPQGAQAGYQLLEYMTTYQENITGWTRYSQGTTADSLNHTATGINIITNKSDQRIELIARVFAETGVTQLFNLILKLICQHQPETQVNLGGQWKAINPAAWRDRFQLVVNVGLGTGNKDQQAQHLMSLMQIQEKAAQIGVVDPTNVYNAAAEYTKAVGFKQPEKFFSDPSKQPPKQPEPSPDAIKAQNEAQKAQQDAMLAQWKAQQEIQLQREKLEAEIALKREEMLLKYQLQSVQRETAAFAPIYQQAEQMIDDTGAPEANAATGNGAGPAGFGGAGAPVIPGGIPGDAGQDQPPMGGIPGA